MNKILALVIARFKKIRQQKFLDAPAAHKDSFAMVGAGTHATTNLYPCLWHLGIPVKTICTAHDDTAAKAARRWPGCTGTSKLDDILHDPGISAVIVSTHPGQQWPITRRLLEAGKHVYVEKPLGSCLQDLIEIQKIAAGNILMVGLQRRFAPITSKTKKLITSPVSYHYRFLVGAYPEGDPFYDLFIHPVDHALTLFGKATFVSATITQNAGMLTCFLVLDHNGVKGNFELSTHHTWNYCREEMNIITADKIIVSNYPNELHYVKKQRGFLNLPLEKLTGPEQTKKVVMQSNDFNPVGSNNSLYLMGFYPSLETFSQRVAKRAAHSTDMEQLVNVYELLDQLKLIAKQHP